MAVIANTFETYASKGNREQLSDIIYDISPTDTPFMSMAGREKTGGTLSEWQTDALAAAVSTNQQIEGDDITSFGAVTPTVRLGNYVEISRKTLIVADTQEEIEKAGRKSEIGYQLAKLGKELKRDMEKSALENKAAVAGSSGVARVTAGLGAWVKTNVDKEATGVNPVYTTLPNDDRTDSASPRAFTETMLKNVISQCWTSGAEPSIIMVGAFNKGAISAFSGIATKTIDQSTAKPAVIVGAADVYVSDFGVFRVVANRFQRARDAWILDPEYVSLVFLRPFRTNKLAKTGDAEKRYLLAEWGTKVKNEKAIGLVADLTAA
jgi:hypothetical protein